LLYNYAVKGLRTLVLSKKLISQEDYTDWNSRYKNAQALINNREQELEKLQEEIEKGLELVGATAIEDKLQDEVGEFNNYFFFPVN
jgi:magnesium-transporting ATPase (P-type)